LPDSEPTESPDSKIDHRRRLGAPSAELFRSPLRNLPASDLRDRRECPSGLARMQRSGLADAKPAEAGIGTEPARRSFVHRPAIG
jgi:hypothetical protein